MKKRVLGCVLLVGALVCGCVSKEVVQKETAVGKVITGESDIDTSQLEELPEDIEDAQSASNPDEMSHIITGGTDVDVEVIDGLLTDIQDTSSTDEALSEVSVDDTSQLEILEQEDADFPGYRFVDYGRFLGHYQEYPLEGIKATLQEDVVEAGLQYGEDGEILELIMNLSREVCGEEAVPGIYAVGYDKSTMFYCGDYMYNVTKDVDEVVSVEMYVRAEVGDTMHTEIPDLFMNDGAETNEE